MKQLMFITIIIFYYFLVCSICNKDHLPMFFLMKYITGSTQKACLFVVLGGDFLCFQLNLVIGMEIFD